MNQNTYVDYHSLSEILLINVFNSVDQGIAILNEQNIIVQHNNKFMEFLGIERVHLAGNTIEQYISPDFLIEGDKNIFMADKVDNILVIEVKNISLYNDLNYKLILVGISQEGAITKREYEKILHDKDVYEAVLNTISDGVTIIDDEGKVVFFNKAAEKIEGLYKNEVIGKHMTEVYPVSWEDSYALKALQTRKKILNQYQTYVTKRRQVIAISNNYPIYIEGKLAGAASTFRDYSKFQEIVNKNFELQAKLQDKKSDKGVYDVSDHYTFEDIIGTSMILKKTIEHAKNASLTNSPVFIYGETGTGKELFAQSIHYSSNRANGPFLAINCAAIPETLLEGILFGTSKGVFTGAVDKPGLFEQANGGTLFLDEINSMPLALQSKLLRVLQEKKVRRLGHKEEVPFDARIISSCNIDPMIAINKQQIRNDLFYRLAVVYISVPPLRDRTEDIDILCSHFIKTFNRQFNKSVNSISSEVRREFHNYKWPGNVRQLKNSIESVMNIVPQESLTIEKNHIPHYLGLFSEEKTNKTIASNYDIDTPMEQINKESTFDNSKIAYHSQQEDQKIVDNSTDIFEKIKRDEKRTIINALSRNSGNITKAASELGMSRQKLQYRLKKYNIRKH
ncbi:arginine utilization regulatory protein [Dethiosulfatibacter aminovorans DSM 17477]|uniref:Arginine utilization regulatory protein n=1 Tax=Dethiosulfatibacter aminovorans DSM 17477 TaxID=1121476 RepID=A0A1M6M3X0_9FIRM|nr:sigma 54-interacting transcriptional regulator [Dethiosulfatibacter aminovorans]SHJ78060.1 arginine utilization regulatory protein [Dethiosulfatibacter aminovorans DSM 17477]